MDTLHRNRSFRIDTKAKFPDQSLSPQSAEIFQSTVDVDAFQGFQTAPFVYLLLMEEKPKSQVQPSLQVSAVAAIRNGHHAEFSLNVRLSETSESSFRVQMSSPY